MEEIQWELFIPFKDTGFSVKEAYEGQFAEYVRTEEVQVEIDLSSEELEKQSTFFLKIGLKEIMKILQERGEKIILITEE